MAVKLDKTALTWDAPSARLAIAPGRQLYVFVPNGALDRYTVGGWTIASETQVQGYSDEALTAAISQPFSANAGGQYDVWFADDNYDLYAPADATAKMTRWQPAAGRANRGYINPKDAPYLAMGNGSTDDTSAWLLATEDARNAGKQLIMPNGTFKVSANIAQQSNPNRLRIQGDGDGVSEFTMAAGMVTPVIGLVGVLAAGVAVTVARVAGDYVLTLASTAGMSAGMYLRLLDTTQPIYGLSTRTAVSCASEWVRIKTVDSATQVTLKQGLEYGYSTSATARLLSLPVSCDLSGFSIRNLNPATLAGTARGISLTYFAEARVEHIGFQDMDAHNINLLRGVGGVVHDIRSVDTQDLETANSPYLISASSSQDLLVSHLRQRYGRHCFTSGGDQVYGLASHNHISDAIAMEMSATAFDTHPGTTKTTFENCHAHHSFRSEVFKGVAYETSGFQLRGPDHDVIGCSVTGVANRGVYVVHGADRCRVIAARLDDCDIGVESDGSHDCYVGGGTMIQRPRTVGIKTSVGAAYTGFATRLFVGETLVTGDPTGYAINNAADLEVVYV